MRILLSVSTIVTLLLSGGVLRAAPPYPESTVGLTLADTIARAEAASAALEQARALERSASAGVDGARAAGRARLEFNGSYQRSSDVPELMVTFPGRGPLTVFPNLNDSYRSRLDLSVPLYTGGRVEKSVEAARQELTAASHDVESAREDLVLEATAAYWSIVTARETARVLTSAVASYEAHLKDAENRRKVGMAARGEVLAVQVERDRAALARLQAENLEAVAAANLARILDLPRGTRLEPADQLDATEIASAELEPLIARALSRRPERSALEARLAAARARVRVAKAAREPQVNAGAGFDYANPNPRVLPLRDDWNDTWDASVRVSFNIFDGGRTAADTAQASQRVEAASQQLLDLDRRIRLQVQQRFLELQTARQAVDVACRNVEAARESSRETTERFRAGVASNTERLDAEVAELRVGLDRTEAYSRLRLAQATLVRATGRP